MQNIYDESKINIKPIEGGYSYFIYDPLLGRDIEMISIYKTKTKMVNGEIDNRYYTIRSNKNINIPFNILERIMEEAIMFILSHNYLIEILPDDKTLNAYLNRYENSKLVSDIDLIALDGEYDVNDETLNKFIEKPVRKACIDLTNNGINTVMSSCNKKNFYSSLNLPEEVMYIGHYEKDKKPWFIGNGYAWIMIDWESFNDLNKSYLLGLHDGLISIDLNDKEKNILNKISDGNQNNLVCLFEYQKVDEFIAALLDCVSKKEKDKILLSICNRKIKIDKNFDSRSKVLYGCNSLNNHGSYFRMVVLRYPIDEYTKIEEVEKYFDGIIKKLIQNQPTINQTEKVLEFV